MVPPGSPWPQLGSTTNVVRGVSTSESRSVPVTDCCSIILQAFQDYLVHLVNTAPDDFHIILHTAIPEHPKKSIDSTRPVHGEAVKELEIRILTPAFYSRLVHYAYTSEAFDRECIFTDEKNRTCWVSRPELLAELLSHSVSTRSQSVAAESLLSELKWTFLKRLRSAPAQPAYNATPQNTEFRVADIRAVRYSEMDDFVRNQRSRDCAGTYRRIVTKLFLAQRLCLGFPQIITLVDWTLRTLMCYCAARQVSYSLGLTQQSSLEKGWWSLSRGIATVIATHAYALLKGYQ